MEKFRDMFNYQIMKETYISVVDEYKKKTESLRANYKKFLEQDENLITTTKQINARIYDLTVRENVLHFTDPLRTTSTV